MPAHACGRRIRGMTNMVTERGEQRPRAFESDVARWEAVRRRDRNADGAFLYSVETTGVYCRPSCASRASRREHVRFHASCEAAERSGFRPCKRCLPREGGLSERRAAAIARACRLVAQAEAPPTLDELAAAAGMSRFHFQRVFKMVCGVTPKAYVDAHRARRMHEVLSSAPTVTEAIYDAGFNSNAPFYATADERLGMTPTAYRRGGAGSTIRFALGQCSLGSILVAATERGVCAISLGDDPDALLRDLADRFPRAHLAGADAEFERFVARAVGLVEAPGENVDLPLDVRGTAFQQRVWEALRAVPAGTTTSYAELARRLGRPTATRAVARACAANPLAVAIPCHRVVRTDGGLSGYRWGVARKRTLLEREARP